MFQRPEPSGSQVWDSVPLAVPHPLPAEGRLGGCSVHFNDPSYMPSAGAPEIWDCVFVVVFWLYLEGEVLPDGGDAAEARRGDHMFAALLLAIPVFSTVCFQLEGSGVLQVESASRDCSFHSSNNVATLTPDAFTLFLLAQLGMCLRMLKQNEKKVTKKERVEAGLVAARKEETQRMEEAAKILLLISRAAAGREDISEGPMAYALHVFVSILTLALAKEESHTDRCCPGLVFSKDSCNSCICSSSGLKSESRCTSRHCPDSVEKGGVQGGPPRFYNIAIGEDLSTMMGAGHAIQLVMKTRLGKGRRGHVSSLMDTGVSSTARSLLADVGRGGHAKKAVATSKRVVEEDYAQTPEVLDQFFAHIVEATAGKLQRTFRQGPKVFGMLTFVLNFIPNVGAAIAELLPVPLVLLDPDRTVSEAVFVFLIPFIIHNVLGCVLENKLLQHGPPGYYLCEIGQMSDSQDQRPTSFQAGADEAAKAEEVWGIAGAMLSVPLTSVIRLWLEEFDHPYAKVACSLINGPQQRPVKEADQQRADAQTAEVEEHTA
ncbi:hypothetical protein AK812_SmicGene11494 [Symbiodinium microadriaticum]|uniref:Pacifastin domain-containing protein n=1 Tax=Symbiodinium microadriaticum TaxID=2951 RepID=A0A1Q9ED00_SYMMI|nr:hypothetical protein AK812_SmicGene11494 [Symbiodinium microadriaticum]